MILRSKGWNIRVACSFQSQQLGKVFMDDHPIRADRVERLHAPAQEHLGSGRGIPQQVQQIQPNLCRTFINYPLHAQGEGSHHIIHVPINEDELLGRFSNGPKNVAETSEIGLAQGHLGGGKDKVKDVPFDGQVEIRGIVFFPDIGDSVDLQGPCSEPEG